MGCLYCGKEIGPFRVLRDREFCSSVHRKSYGARLGKALGQLAAPEPPPAGIAAFRIGFPIQPGNNQRTPERGYQNRLLGSMKMGTTWPVTLAPPLGGSFRPFRSATAEGPIARDHGRGISLPIPPRTRLPGFELATIGFEDVEVAPVKRRKSAPAPATVPAIPTLSDVWMPLAAQPVECWIQFRSAEAMAPAISSGAPSALAHSWVTGSESSRPRLRNLSGPITVSRNAAAPAERPVASSVAERMSAALPICAPQIDELSRTENVTGGISSFAAASWQPVAEAQAAECLVASALAEPMSAALPIRQPQIDALAGAVTATLGAAIFTPESWMPAAGPQAAECFLATALAESMPAALPIRQPQIETLAGAVTAIHGASSFAPQSWTRSAEAQAAECLINYSLAEPMSATFPMQQPEIAGLAAEVTTGSDVSLPAPAVEATPAPAPIQSWMAVAEAQAAECLVNSAVSEPMFAGVAMCEPGFGGISITSTFVPSVSLLAQPAAAEAAAVTVTPVLDSQIAVHAFSPAHLQFALRTIDDVSSRLGGGLQAPESAGARPGLAAEPVECAPAFAAFVPVPLASSAALCFQPLELPLTALVPMQAPSVAGIAAAAVESLPSVGQPVPVAIEMRSALRLPFLTRFQPAQDTAEALAAPVAAPGPVAVESTRNLAGLTLVARPVVPAAMVQGFDPELVAQFGFPSVESPAPHFAEPPQGERQPAILDPISRIATPAGARPERPLPVMPRPELFALEYHAQPITSSPVQRIEVLTSSQGITILPFTMATVADEQLHGKRSLKVVPFEEIAAKAEAAQRKRMNLSAMGKVAAAVMVGIALWTGMRIANLSQHTERLTAQVATSERSVSVAESLGKDPTEVNYGPGTMGKVKRAIAVRAATEITDTFKSGMTAWGAETKAWAPGWKRHPQGYVSVGDMALFRPSLKYTDYRMEFYGQIESKSMGWVVRAQDRKNYYAMKFTVIEAGLRPMIAMVHYGVKNGNQMHKVQTPLNVMVHNNQPYHVAVDVRGNRFTASIEGEPIETWTDDTLAQGGVGFFSDAGEKARLYWMKLSRNQDWLGRFCAYLSDDGRSHQQIAELWGPEIPRDIPQPVHPQMPQMAVVADEGSGRGESPSRLKIGKHWRNEKWNS